MKKFTFFLFIFCSFISNSQSFDYSLNGKVNLSDLIFEGRVISKTSLWNSDKSSIYTSNKVLVLKEFKGMFATDTVEVITRGGQVDDMMVNVTHTLTFGIGQEGIFFCKQTDCENIKIDRVHSYRMLYDGMGFIRIYSDPFNPPAVSEQQVYHDIQKEVYQPIVDITKTPVKILRQNRREEKKLQPKLHSGLKADSLHKDSLRSIIYYDLQNLQLNATNATFDIYSHLPSAQKLYGGGCIIYKYDTTVLGSNIATSGRMTANLASNLDPVAYTLAQSNLAPNIAQMKITPTSALSAANSLSLAQSAVPMLNVQVSPLQTSTAFTDTTVALDSVPMQQQSTYLDTTTSALTAFDTVKVTDNVKTLRDDETISFTLGNFVVNDSANTISFSIFATGGPDTTSLFSAGIVLNFDTAAFGPFIYGSDVVFDDSGALTTNYNINFTDVFCCGTELQVDITNSSGTYATVSSTPLDIADLTMTFAYPRCLNAAGIVGDNSNTPYDSSYYWDNINAVPVSYVTSSVTGQYNNALCQPPNPHITGLEPNCIGAGSFDSLIIYGYNFGDTVGTVYFRKANYATTGEYVQTYPGDILSWTGTEIHVLVPDAVYGSYGTQGASISGGMYVETHSYLNNIADTGGNIINIGYAHFNARLNNYPYLPSLMYLKRSSYNFQIAPSLFSTPGAVQSIIDDIADINCQTGLNYQLQSSTPSAISNPVAGDNINLIGIQPRTYFSDSTILQETTLTSRLKSCYNGLSYYFDTAYYLTDADIEVTSSPPSGGAWNWSDSVNVTSSQFDLATALLHELGHCSLIDHNGDSTSVMYSYERKGRMLRTFGHDPNDVLGILNVFSTGSIVAVNGCSDSGSAVQAYPSSGSCPNLTPVACTPYLSNGINSIDVNTNSFSAYLYPNPSQDNTTLHIDISQEDNITISVYDMMGQVIFEKMLKADAPFDVPLSMGTKSSGVYLVAVYDLKNKRILKLIKI